MSKVTPEFLANLKSKPIGPDVMALIEEVERMAEEAVHLKEEIEDHEASFELRWKADMRAIKQWQEAHPGNDHIWPDHADLCMWLIGEVERLKGENDRLRKDLQHQAVLTGGPQEAIDNALKEIDRLRADRDRPWWVRFLRCLGIRLKSS